MITNSLILLFFCFYQVLSNIPKEIFNDSIFLQNNMINQTRLIFVNLQQNFFKGNTIILSFSQQLYELNKSYDFYNNCLAVNQQSINSNIVLNCLNQSKFCYQLELILAEIIKYNEEAANYQLIYQARQIQLSYCQKLINSTKSQQINNIHLRRITQTSIQDSETINQLVDVYGGIIVSFMVLLIIQFTFGNLYKLYYAIDYLQMALFYFYIPIQQNFQELSGFVKQLSILNYGFIYYIFPIVNQEYYYQSTFTLKNLQDDYFYYKIIPYFLVIVLIIIIFSLSKLFKNMKKLQKVCHQIEKYYIEFNIVIDFIWISQYCFSFFIINFIININSTVLCIFGISLGSIYVISTNFFIIICFRNTSNNLEENNQLQTDLVLYGNFTKDIQKNKSQMQYGFKYLLYMRRIVFIIILAILYENHVIACLLLIFQHLIVVLITLIYKPYINRTQTIINIISEILLSIINILFLVGLDESQKITSGQDNQSIIFWIIVSTYLCLLIIQTLYSYFVTFQTIIQRIKNSRYSSKVQSMNLNNKQQKKNEQLQLQELQQQKIQNFSRHLHDERKKTIHQIQMKKQKESTNIFTPKNIFQQRKRLGTNINASKPSEQQISSLFLHDTQAQLFTPRSSQNIIQSFTEQQEQGLQSSYDRNLNNSFNCIENNQLTHQNIQQVQKSTFRNEARKPSYQPSINSSNSMQHSEQNIPMTDRLNDIDNPNKQKVEDIAKFKRASKFFESQMININNQKKKVKKTNEKQ